jgi:hypothetical protein
MTWNAWNYSKQVRPSDAALHVKHWPLQTGARLLGVVEPCGLGETIPHEGVASADELWEDCFHSNEVLLAQLRPDEFETELMKQTKADAALGRMTVPVLGIAVSVSLCVPAALVCAAVSECDLHNVRLHPRFGIEQGKRFVCCIKIRKRVGLVCAW